MPEPLAHMLPRYRPIPDPATRLLATVKMPSVATQRPTRLRPLPSRFCYQCGSPVPPWRDDCAVHHARLRPALPLPPRLLAIDPDDVTALSTCVIPACLSRY